MIKLTGIFVAKDESTTMNKTPKKWRKALGFARIFLAFALFTFVGCGPRNTGDLIGVQGRGLWFHPQPFGTVYIPSGTYHSGQSDQDVFQSFVDPNKKVSIVTFCIDDT